MLDSSAAKAPSALRAPHILETSVFRRLFGLEYLQNCSKSLQIRENSPKPPKKIRLSGGACGGPKQPLFAHLLDTVTVTRAQRPI
jgi:hypothetical protein